MRDYTGRPLTLPGLNVDKWKNEVFLSKATTWDAQATVYRATSAPAGTDYNEGDIWIDTTSSRDLPYTWKVGTGWIAMYTYIDAGYLKTGIIDCSILTLRTAGAGTARIVIDSNRLITYNAANDIECYVGTDGFIYAASGNVWIGHAADDVDELGIKGATFRVYTGTTKVGVVSGTAAGLFFTNPANNDANGIADIIITPGVAYGAYAAGKAVITGIKTTDADVSASRTFDTVYQNTSGVPKEVNISFVLVGANRGVHFFIGATSSPASSAGLFYKVNADTMNLALTKIVPVDWYYTITRSNGDESIYEWRETGIGL